MKTILITGGSGDIAQAIDFRLSSDYLILRPDRHKLDVTNHANVRSYMEEYKPDILINNAGYISPSKVAGLPEELCYLALTQWLRQIEVNLIGTYLCSKFALRNGCQRIINIGSSAGGKGKAQWSAYCAAKAGVERLTESLAEEGNPTVCLAIGRTKTKMRHSLYGEEDSTTLMSPNDVATVVEQLVNESDSDFNTVSGHIIPLSVKDFR